MYLYRNWIINLLIVPDHCYHKKWKGYKKERKKPSCFSELNPSGFELFISNENGLQETKVFHEDSFIYLWTKATSPHLIWLGWKSYTSWMSGSLTSCHLTLFKWDTNKCGVKKCQ